MERPNILFLMTDQHRWDALGCAGNRAIRTPNIDRLASSGIRFSQACTPTPVCVAARMTLITGHRSSRHHWMTNRCLPGPLPELPTLMSLLLREGYWTQGIGKMHFRGRHYGLRKLLTMEECVAHINDDDYLMYLRSNRVRTRFPMGIRDLLYFQPQTSGIPLEHSMTNWVADRSVEFLRNHVRYRSGQPFFLWSSCASPHPPFAPCEPYDSMYEPDEMELPVDVERSLTEMPSSLWAGRGRLDGAHHDPDRMRRIRALYYGLVTHVDHAFGRILQEIEDLNISEQTVVVFFSDHGEMMGDHGLCQKNCPYEGSVRIPLILRWPGRADRGRICDDLVGLTDIMPTFLDELGLAYPESLGPLAGDSLLGSHDGGLASEREEFIIDYGWGRNRWIAARGRTHKYCLFAEGGREELYDLSEDPWETRNLLGARPDLARSARETVLEWERNHGPPTSFQDGIFRIHPAPAGAPSEEEVREVVLNEGPWPKRLPPDERNRVESYAEAFDRAVLKETTISPWKLSLRQYKEKVFRIGPRDPGGESLKDTVWGDAWKQIAID